MHKLLAIKSDLPAYLIKHAVEILVKLDDLYTELQPEGPRLLDNYLSELMNNGPEAERSSESLKKMFERYGAPGYKMTKKDAENLISCMIFTALNVGVQALQATSEENAVAHLLNAEHLRGGAALLVWNGDDSLVLAELARRGAKATNAVHQQVKQNVFAWCDQNFAKHKSREAAAYAVMKIEPIRIVTARKYIKEWEEHNS